MMELIKYMSCKLCEKIWNSKEEYQKSVESHWDEEEVIVLDNGEPSLYIPIEDDYYSDTYITVNFCPECGRRIKDE